MANFPKGETLSNKNPFLWNWMSTNDTFDNWYYNCVLSQIIEACSMKTIYRNDFILMYKNIFQYKVNYFSVNPNNNDWCW